MKKTVEHLIKLAQKECEQIITYYKNEKDEDFKSDTFDSPISFLTGVSEKDLKENAKKLRGRHGVYIFVIIRSLNISVKEIGKWNDIKGGRITFTGNINDISKSNGDCFYIGSCYRHSLMTRIQEHFSEEKGPASLKLNNRNRKWIKASLKAYCFPIQDKYSKEEMRIVLSTIEKELHNKLKAVAGSNRV